MPRIKPLAAVAALSVVSLCIRIGIAFNGGLWRDEALFLGVVSLPTWGAMIDFLKFHESHPPLFYAMMRVWLSVFGRSDAAALWLPILIGVLTVPAMYAVGAKLFSQRAGLIAALLVTLSPPLNEYGSSVRPYSLLPLMALVSTYLLIVAIERGGKRAWLGYALVATAMVYTHNWAWVVLGGQAAAVGIRLVRMKERRGEVLTGGLIAVAVVMVAFVPWMEAFQVQAKQAGHSPVVVEGISGWLSLISDALLLTLQATLLTTPAYGLELVIAAFVLATALLIAAYVRPRNPLANAQYPASSHSDGAAQNRKDAIRRATPVLIAILIVALGIATAGSVHSNLLPGRCLVILSPFVLLLVASRFDRGLALTVTDLRLRAAVTAVAITLGGAYVAGVYDLMKRPRSNARELTDWVNRNALSNDLVIVAPGWLASSFNHYSRLPARVIAYPDTSSNTLFDFAGVWMRMSDQAPLDLVRSRIGQAAEADRRVWLITDDVSRQEITDAERALAANRVIWAAARMRVADIRRSLFGAFGAPSRVSVASRPRPTQETLVAELFEQTMVRR